MQNIQVYGVIYKITNKVNSKIYIGQTTRKNGFDGRYLKRKNPAQGVYEYYKKYKEKFGNRYNKRLLNSMEKYGVNNFDVSKVFDVAFSKEELNIKEIFWISYYKSYDRNYGYNYEMGGNNSPIAESTKKKMRKSSLPSKIDYIFQIDKNNNIINKFESYKMASDITNIPRVQITNNVIGQKKTCHGYVFIRESNFNKDFKNPLLKYKKNLKVKKVKPKQIICLNTLEKFSSIKEASLKYKLDASGIAKNCKREYSYYGKLKNGECMVWVYYDEYKKMTKEEISYRLSNVNIKTKKVICTTTNKIFASIKEASIFYNCCNSKIVEVCKGRRKTCGKLDDGTPLQWKYYNI